MENIKYKFGMIGLGTMGSNLLLNIADHGFSGAGYDKDPKQVASLNGLCRENVKGFDDLKEFIQSLEVPRALMMLVPAGKIVDEVIAALLPLLDKGDIIIDGGNSHFTDTELRSTALEKQGFHFFGMGISGGEEGARNGPSMMPGGDKDAYKHVQHILEEIAARVNGEPCVTYIGPGASGHFAKMVHNGIEYALMQLIADTYEILRKGLHLDNPAIHNIFDQWSKGRLQSYLLDITVKIFSFKNKGENILLLDEIKDEAKSKGTGKWTSQVAMDINLPVPVIDTAVSMRDLSKYKVLRTAASALYPEAPGALITGSPEYLPNLEQTFYFGMVTIYAQGMHLLYKASESYNYQLKLDQIAKIWRGGCIIRSAFLENIYTAFHSNAQLENILLDTSISKTIKESLYGIRKIVSDAALRGLAAPAYFSSLAYFDAFRSEKMPANLIQAQRDFFGAHTYERNDHEGIFHTQWNQ